MKKNILIIISTFIISCKAPQVMEEINKIYLYDYFEIRGFTTAGAYNHFNNLNERNVNKKEISQADCEKINLILKNIKPKRLYQSKLGISNIFMEIKTENSNLKVVICLPNVIIDLSNKQEYWINDNENLKWLSEFTKKYKTINFGE